MPKGKSEIKYEKKNTQVSQTLEIKNQHFTNVNKKAKKWDEVKFKACLLVTRGNLKKNLNERNKIKG